MRPKTFVIIFIICLYYRHTHHEISQRQHVFHVYVIHSNCARLHNFFFFMMGYGENGYLQDLRVIHRFLCKLSKPVMKKQIFKKSESFDWIHKKVFLSSQKIENKKNNTFKYIGKYW